MTDFKYHEVAVLNAKRKLSLVGNGPEYEMKSAVKKMWSYQWALAKKIKGPARVAYYLVYVILVKQVPINKNTSMPSSAFRLSGSLMKKVRHDLLTFLASRFCF